MNRFKIVDNGYIMCIGEGDCGTRITEEEYAQITEALQNKPESTETKGYRLRTDLAWEPFDITPIDQEEEELTEDEVLSILMGEE